ncbi:IclR family transcriptional regulator [Aureimonas flava]|uniref:IclR family transcriptional regulator n=1 Tax=Aureimonas flava TaxID=2320271 RepID=A0A3A1WQJ1_9HYPH|nr:IclR family transcriptional regulator [Aureimonas flava]RIY03334.1 IclR family transcriptional regulator [Aureimonas flava]
MSIDRQETLSEDGARYSAPALEKGLDILEHLSSTRAALNLGELADALGRTRSEIFRMVAVLEARGYLDRAGTDRFVVADKLFRLGLNRPLHRSLTEAALPVMRDFAETTGYSCHLAVPSGTQMVVIARTESVSHIGFSVRIGYRQPLVRTGSGHCLLAFMSERRRERTLSAIAEEEPGFDFGDLDARLDRFRRAGRIVRASGITDGVTDVSLPIFDPEDTGAVAALTCPHLRILHNPVEPEELADEVARAAGRISAALAAPIAAPSDTIDPAPPRAAMPRGERI